MPLRILLGLSVVLSLCAAASAQVARTGDPAKRGYTEADFPRVQKLAEGVYSYEALRSAGAERFTTVSLFVVTPAGVLVADGQGSVDETRKMVDAIKKVTDRPITHLVIGSDHGDHTAGNSVFPTAITTYVHPTSKATLEGAGRSNAPGPVAALPGTIEVVSDRTTISLGGREIQVLFLGRAHTGGDLSVYLPAEKILFMSEAYLNRIFPAMRSAYPSEWVATIERAQKLGANVYVPGHGFVETPSILQEELATFRQAIVTVIAEAKRLRAAGLAADAAAKEAKFGDLESWTLRGSQGATAITRVYMELDGRLK